MSLSYERNTSIDNEPGSSIGPAEISVDQRIHGIDSGEVRSLLEGDTDTQCFSANCAKRKKGSSPEGKQCCYIDPVPCFVKNIMIFSFDESNIVFFPIRTMVASNFH